MALGSNPGSDEIFFYRFKFVNSRDQTHPVLMQGALPMQARAKSKKNKFLKKLSESQESHCVAG